MIRLLLVVGFIVLVGGDREALAEERRRVVVLTSAEWPDQLLDALQVEMAARGFELEAVAGAAVTSLYATARELEGGVAAVVWLEQDNRARIRLFAVAAGGRPRISSLPSGPAEIPPRVFALIAGGLIEETVAPPLLPTDVEVDLDVEVGGEMPVDEAVATPPAIDRSPPSSVAATTLSLDRSVEPGESGKRWFLAAGALAAPVSGGLEASIGYYASDSLRLGLQADLVYVLPAEQPAMMVGLAIARSRAGSGGSLVALNLGYVTMEDAAGWAAGGWWGWRWPFGQRFIEAKIGIEIGVIDGEKFVPVPLASLTIDQLF